MLRLGYHLSPVIVRAFPKKTPKKQMLLGLERHLIGYRADGGVYIHGCQGVILAPALLCWELVGRHLSAPWCQIVMICNHWM
jgi:hypothetical protein